MYLFHRTPPIFANKQLNLHPLRFSLIRSHCVRDVRDDEREGNCKDYPEEHVLFAWIIHLTESCWSNGQCKDRWFFFTEIGVNWMVGWIPGQLFSSKAEVSVDNVARVSLQESTTCKIIIECPSCDLFIAHISICSKLKAVLVFLRLAIRCRNTTTSNHFNDQNPRHQ